MGGISQTISTCRPMPTDRQRADFMNQNVSHADPCIDRSPPAAETPFEPYEHRFVGPSLIGAKA